MECQQFEAFHLGKSRGYATTIIHNRTTSCLSRQICIQKDLNHVLKWASTEHQHFLRWHPGWYNRNGMQIYHNDPIGSVYWQKCNRVYRVRLLQLSDHGGSRLRSLHCNKQQYAVPKSRFTWSVIEISPFIQHQKYACNVWLIWIFSL
jgi:hypothetical protein